MHLKKLILTLLAVIIRTALHGQFQDSSIAVQPHVFDYLIMQDVKAQKCAVENINFRAEISNLGFQLKETKLVLQTTSDILRITNEEKGLLNETIILKDRVIKKQSRQIAGLKIGCFSVGVLGAVSTIYFIVR